VIAGTISESAIAIPVLCIYSIGGIYYYGHGLVSKSELFQARQIASADAITTAVARASFPTRHAPPSRSARRWGESTRSFSILASEADSHENTWRPAIV
jgi:hypothetical protein